MFPPSLLGLYCCSFGESGQAGLDLGRSPSTHTMLPRLVSFVPGSKHFPDINAGTLPYSVFPPVVLTHFKVGSHPNHWR
jgi:hypothetical protein